MGKKINSTVQLKYRSLLFCTKSGASFGARGSVPEAFLNFSKNKASDDLHSVPEPWPWNQ